MSNRLTVSLTAPFALGDVAANVALENGQVIAVVLRDGQFSADLPSRPLRMMLSAGSAPSGERALRVASPADGGMSGDEGSGPPVDVNNLFDDPGCNIPSGGVLKGRLVWGAQCHGEQHPESGEGRRFASWEHVICAEYVGLASAPSDWSEPTRPLTINGIRAPFNKNTFLPLAMSSRTFGEIVCLAGDFYAHLDDSAVRDFEWAWPPISGIKGWLAGDYRASTLVGDEEANVAELLGVIRRDKDAHHNAAGEFAALAYDTAKHDYPARRYLALSSQNYCHFACPGPNAGGDHNEALRLYRAYHERALGQAQAARQAESPESALLSALATDAFGCHFLSDLFASGHIRVPRRLLGENYGILRGALYMSRVMHDEDNTLGLWCTPRLQKSGQSRFVWRAYGDGVLRQPKADSHRRMVQEAIRRSAAEIFAAYCRVTLPESERAVALLPVPLGPGETPGPQDRTHTPGGAPDAAPPNHWPLYWFKSDGTVTRRTGEPSENHYKSASLF
jgi:hypothetical protein